MPSSSTERRASSPSSAVWLAIVIAVSGCVPAAAPLRSVDPSAAVVVPYKVAGGGEIRFTVKPRYTQGGPVTFDLDITAGAQQIIGPLSGVVLQSNLAGEQTVRHFRPQELTALEVAPGQRAHATETWDGRLDTGDFVIAETFSLALDFIVGGETVRLGTVIEIRSR